jgi:hypothetical protein
MLHLINRALPRLFVETPANNFCTVPKSVDRKMIVGNFNDHFGSDWFPLAAAIRTPTAGAAGGAGPRNGNQRRLYSSTF